MMALEPRSPEPTMSRSFLALSLVAASAASAAFAGEPPRPAALDEVPASLAPAVARAGAAADALRDQFLKRVTAMLAQGGPMAAMSVCPTEAPRIAKHVGEVHRVEIGRTS